MIEDEFIAALDWRMRAFVRELRADRERPFFIVSQLAGFARAHEGGKIRVVEIEYDPTAGAIVISKWVYLGEIEHIEYEGISTPAADVGHSEDT